MPQTSSSAVPSSSKSTDAKFQRCDTTGTSLTALSTQAQEIFKAKCAPLVTQTEETITAKNALEKELAASKAGSTTAKEMLVTLKAKLQESLKEADIQAKQRNQDFQKQISDVNATLESLNIANDKDIFEEVEQPACDHEVQFFNTANEADDTIAHPFEPNEEHDEEYPSPEKKRKLSHLPAISKPFDETRLVEDSHEATDDSNEANNDSDDESNEADEERNGSMSSRGPGAQMQKEQEKTRDSMQNVESSAKETARSNDALEQKIKTLESELTNAKATIADLSEDKEFLNKYLEIIRKEAARSNEALNQRNETLESSLEYAKICAKEASTRKECLENSLTDAKAAATELSQRNECLKNSLTNAKATIIDLFANSVTNAEAALRERSLRNECLDSSLSDAQVSAKKAISSDDTILQGYIDLLKIQDDQQKRLTEHKEHWEKRALEYRVEITKLRQQMWAKELDDTEIVLSPARSDLQEAEVNQAARPEPLIEPDNHTKDDSLKYLEATIHDMAQAALMSKRLHAMEIQNIEGKVKANELSIRSLENTIESTNNMIKYYREVRQDMLSEAESLRTELPWSDCEESTTSTVSEDDEEENDEEENNEEEYSEQEGDDFMPDDSQDGLLNFFTSLAQGASLYPNTEGN